MTPCSLVGIPKKPRASILIVQHFRTSKHFRRVYSCTLSMEADYSKILVNSEYTVSAASH